MNSWPYFESDDIKKAEEILRSGKINYWTGNEGREFEKEFSEYVGVNHSVAVDNGTNARMTEIQSGIGRLQLKKLNSWIDRRTHLSNIFNDAFKHLNGLRITLPPSHIKHAYYKYYVFTEPEKLKSDKDRDFIMNSLNDEGIACYSGSCSEIYKEKAFDKVFSDQKPLLKVAKELGETSLMFLVHPTINEDDIYEICDKTEKIIKQCQR